MDNKAYYIYIDMKTFYVIDRDIKKDVYKNFLKDTQLDNIRQLIYTIKNLI